MKYFIHSIAFIIAFQACSVYGQMMTFMGNNIDTMVVKDWQNGMWENEARTYNTFNADCSVRSSSAQVWDISAWENASLVSFTYFPSKKVNQSTISNWIDPEWMPFARQTHSYDAAEQLARVLNETNFGTGWISQSENIYTYNTRGYLVKDLRRTWNGAEFRNLQQTDYQNNTSGVVTNERVQGWDGAAWENVDSSSYTINGMNEVASAIHFDWEVDQWVNAYKSTGTFSGELLTVVTDELWENGAWVNDGRTTLSYDGEKRITSVLEEFWDVNGGIWVNESLTELSYTSACTVLPLTLLNFEATKSAADIFLKWETTNEINTSGFDIERSTDGTNFQTIGTVQSTGRQTLNRYSYMDKIGNDLNGTLYYRLRMTDIDGKFTISNVAKVTVDSRVTLSLFPNPVGNQLIFITGENMNNAIVSIIGQDGRTLLSQKFGNINGSNKNTIDVSTLPAGVYILRLKNNNRVSTQKFIKQ